MLTEPFKLSTIQSTLIKDIFKVVSVAAELALGSMAIITAVVYLGEIMKN